MIENTIMNYFADSQKYIDLNHNKDDGYEIKAPSLQHKCDECPIVFNKEISLMVKYNTNH